MTTYNAVGSNWVSPGRPNKPAPHAPTVPAAPVSFTATATTPTSVGLSWTPAALPAGATTVTGFRVYVDSVAVATLGVVTSYTLTGLVAGTTYGFQVSAVDSIGESPLSTTQTVTTPTPSGASVPNAPASLSGSVVSDTSVSLSWAAASVPSGGAAVTGYKVYRGSGTLVSTLGNVTTTTVTGLTAGTSYTFYVTAQNTTGASAASPSRSLTTTSTAATTVTPLPPQPALVAYGSSTNISAYAKPGAMVITPRDGQDSAGFKAISAAGGHVLIYLDMMINNKTGRYHDLLLNASQFGAAVPLWPGNYTANSYGSLNDFRVGSILLNKLPGVLELIVAENPHMAGFFADDLGSRSYYPGFNWDTFGTTNQNDYRAGAIAAAQVFHDVAQAHGLITIVNGTWTSGTTAGNGGGYPVQTTHGLSLAEGGCVEHHDGQISYFGPYAGSSSQWGDACAVGHGKPFCFAIMNSSSGLTEFKNDGRYAWICQQTDYGIYPAPWGPFHPTGLASTTSG